jgi:hypothetical protein
VAVQGAWRRLVMHVFGRFVLSNGVIKGNWAAPLGSLFASFAWFLVVAMGFRRCSWGCREWGVLAGGAVGSELVALLS